VSDLLHEAAERFGDAPALVSAGEVVTFREWDRRAVPTRTSSGIVGLVATPEPAFAIALASIWRSGATACLLGSGDPRHGSILAALGDASFPLPLAGEVVAKRPEGADPARGSALPLRPSGTSPASGGGTGPCILVLTSGSTGRPRAIVHTLATLAAAAEGAGTRVPFGPGNRWAATLPLHHVGGLALLFRALVGGGAVAFAPTWREALTLPGITHASVVAAQIAAVASRRGLRAVLVGGGPTAAPLLGRALDAGIPVLATYGSTELASQIATVVPPMRRDDLGSCGPPLPHVEISIVDDAIRVRGSSLALGIWDGMELRPLAGADGFYDTGDLGRLDERGLHVTGRRDLMFVSGGEKVSPEVVERALLALPGVREAIVVPVPHERWGARPVAWVDADEPDRLREVLLEVLPAYLVPDRVVGLPADCPGWPGKRDRVWLRAQAERI
jgi:O-succinylbenzoic acid--CoA ligase